MFNKTLSAILRDPWLLDEHFAQSHLVLVLGFLQGNISGQEFLNGNGDFELPFYLDLAGNRIDAFVNNEGRMQYNPESCSPGSIAVVPFIGPVTKYDGECGEPGLIKKQGWIKLLTANPNCVAYISIIDSPGGQADGTPQTADTIKELSNHMPTAALVVGGAYSAGAWIASGHNLIFMADKYSAFGSIGAYTTIVDYRGYFEAQGFKIKEIYPDESKDKNLSYRQAIDGNITLIKSEIAELAKSFISCIAENRNGKLKSDEWNTGKVFGAKEAVKIGLADGIASLPDVAATLRKQSIKYKTNNQNPEMAKLTKVEALAGIAEPTELQLNEANADFTVAGITGATIVAESMITEAAEITKERDTLKTQNTDLTGKVGTLNTQVTSLTESLSTANASLATANARIAEFEKKPGATHTPAASADTPADTTEQDEIQAQLDALPHNQKADKMFS